MKLIFKFLNFKLYLNMVKDQLEIHHCRLRCK